MTQTFRYLHTSDWQLGMTRWFLGGEAAARYAAARLDAVETMFRIAESERCEAVVVAGDVFDDNLVDSLTWQRTVDVLRTAPVPVYLLPGNHDPYDAASIYRDEVWRDLEPTVTVLTDNAPRTVRDGVEIIGAPLTAKQMTEDPVAAALRGLEARGAGRARGIRVVVGHGATQSRGSVPDPGTIDVGRAAAACRDRWIDAVALGDTHSTTDLHPDGTVWYSGSPEPTDFREEDGGGESGSGQALVVEVSVADDSPEARERPATVTVSPVDVGTWSFLALSAEINGPEDVRDWIARLEELPSKRTTVVKYALTGSVDLTTSTLLDRETDRLAPGFAALYPRERLMDLHITPSDEELADAAWPGPAGAAARRLIEMAGTPGTPGAPGASGTQDSPGAASGTPGTPAVAGGADAATARDALKLLHRLSTSTGQTGHTGRRG